MDCQIRKLGVTAGSVLLVHTSFSKVGPVENGPLGLIRALQAALGPNGTLVMPSMTDDDDHPFDPRSTPCCGTAVVADTFWQLPSVQRSDSPHAFAAIGPDADRITANHPLDVPHGLNSPVGHVYDLDGQILPLGVGQDANTTIHLAESLAGVRYRRRKSVTIVEGGKLTRYCYGEIDHCCDNFNLVDQWFDADGRQRRGPVGYGKDALRALEMPWRPLRVVSARMKQCSCMSWASTLSATKPGRVSACGLLSERCPEAPNRPYRSKGRCQGRLCPKTCLNGHRFSARSRLVLPRPFQKPHEGGPFTTSSPH